MHPRKTIIYPKTPVLGRRRAATPKFMQTLDDFIYKELEKIAKKRGITIQELIRAVIVPEWINDRGNEDEHTEVSKDQQARVNSWR